MLPCLILSSKNKTNNKQSELTKTRRIGIVETRFSEFFKHIFNSHVAIIRYKQIVKFYLLLIRATIKMRHDANLL